MFRLLLALALQEPAIVEVAAASRPISISEVRADIDGDGEAEIISLELYDGKRYRDEESWCGKGEKYEGRFRIVVSRLGEETVTDITPAKEVEWFWTRPFSFQLADYNHDGLLDFNLGQYGTCRGWVYRLFTISREGQVSALPVDGGELFNGDRGNATYFPTTARGFRNSFVDPERSVTIVQEFRWDPKARRFRLHRSRESAPRALNP